MNKMGIKGKLKLLSNDRIKTPMLVGLFKTYLILPEVEMSDKELRVI
ncbi:MAG TPA: protease, partial [Pelotomaculum sp.]|nr:protease [Pelotomaculum sp.]